MGFEKTTGMTEYDMLVYLTPLGVEKFYNRGLIDGTKYFSISDSGANYLVYSGLTYNYDMLSGGTYSPTLPTLGHILNLRGTVDRNQIIPRKTLSTNLMSLRSPVWRYPTVEPVEEILTSYKESDGDKYFEKPIVLGGRNMWHTGMTTSGNTAEGFLYYLPPSHITQDYTDTLEPTLGIVTTGATDHVPFPGVSVNDGRRSFTEIQYFYYLNKTNTHMYLEAFSLQNILPVTHTIINTTVDEYYSSEFVKQTHYLDWESVKDGKRYIDCALSVYIPKFIYNKSRIVLLPYEIVRFGVSFEIYEAGSVVTHWRGQNYSDQSAREGQYEFDLVLTSKPELDSTTIYSSTMKVITKVKDSAYNPNTYIVPTPIPGGGTGGSVWEIIGTGGFIPLEG
jgi:hypothetical protein